MNKKVTLVYPPMSISERYNRKTNNRLGHLPPLGIAQIASVLESYGINVNIIDASVMNYTLDETVKAILSTKPDIMGISIITPLYQKAITIIEEIKKINPFITIIVGGAHVTAFKEEILKECKDIDIAIIGEGEYSFLDIVKGKSLREIKGIVYREDKNTFLTGEREPINLDNLPFPARHLLPMSLYKPLPNQYKRKKVISMIVSRGCPYNCIYCFESIGKKFRIKSPEKVIEEIKEIINKYNAEEISFWDDNLMLNKKWLNKFCDLLITSKLNIIWSCYGRVNQADKFILRKMKLAGCWNIFYGIESGNEDILKLIKKEINLEKAKHVIKWTKDAGIEVRASFMLALPSETPEKALNTINFAKELNPDYVQFCITTPYPETELYKNVNKFGKIIENFSKFTVWDVVFIPNNYKDKTQIINWQKRAMREFYLRPIYVIERLLKIKGIDDIKRYIYGLRILYG